MTSGDINHGVSNLGVGPQQQGEGVRLLALGGFLVKRAPSQPDKAQTAGEFYPVFR